MKTVLFRITLLVAFLITKSALSAGAAGADYDQKVEGDIPDFKDTPSLYPLETFENFFKRYPFLEKLIASIENGEKKGKIFVFADLCNTLLSYGGYVLLEGSITENFIKELNSIVEKYPGFVYPAFLTHRYTSERAEFEQDVRSFGLRSDSKRDELTLPDAKVYSTVEGFRHISTWGDKGIVADAFIEQILGSEAYSEPIYIVFFDDLENNLRAFKKAFAQRTNVKLVLFQPEILCTFRLYSDPFNMR